jgi:hypothetical protein
VQFREEAKRKERDTERKRGENDAGAMAGPPATHTHTAIDAFVLELHLVAFGAPVAAGGRELQQVFFFLFFFFFFCTGK